LKICAKINKLSIYHLNFSANMLPVKYEFKT